jgi:hypothetical protein
VQNTGHADLVQRPDGSWAVVFHGVRPRGTSPQFHVLGRETFAAGVEWVDGWPRVGEWLALPGGPVLVDELAGNQLPVSWVSPRRFPDEVLTRDGQGWRLTAVDSDPASDDLAFAGRRQEHLYCRAPAVVDATDGIGGLSVRIDARHSLDVEADGDRVRAVAQVAGMVDGGGFTELGRLDGRYVSTEVAGGMTGRLLGVRCSAGSVVVRSFRYAGADDPGAVPLEAR